LPGTVVAQPYGMSMISTSLLERIWLRDSPRIVPARLFRHDLIPPTIRLEVKPLASSPFGKCMFSGASPLSRVGEYYGRLVERERRCRGGHGEVWTFFRLLVLFRPILYVMGRMLELVMLL
jgi:hypothetical protein